MWHTETAPSDTVVELQCNLDDMTGEELGYAMEILLAQGALDVWFTPIQMKKGRPATQLSLLVRPEDAERLRRAVLENTSTLGVRWRELHRETAEREFAEVETRWGPVCCKIKLVAGRVIGIKPEYEDCARLAREHGLPVRSIAEAARSACAEREALLAQPASGTCEDKRS